MVISAEGIPIAFVFTPGAEADIRGLHRLNLDLPKGSMLFADKAYTDYGLEDFLRNELNIQFVSQRKINAKRKHAPYEALKLPLTRNKIEIVSSSIVGMMPR